MWVEKVLWDTCIFTLVGKCKSVESQAFPNENHFRKESLGELKSHNLSHLWNKNAYNKPCQNWAFLYHSKGFEM